MSKESSHHSIILKKSAFNEADEIITVFSLEDGKCRFLAKSVKLAKSKLQNNLQSLFLSDIRTAGSDGKLLKIIGSEPINTFSFLRQNLSAVKSALSASELVLKFLPDEQPNALVFNLLKDLLEFLDGENLSADVSEQGLLIFKIKFLDCIGLAIKYPAKPVNSDELFFDPGSGGFLSQSKRGIPVMRLTLENFLILRQTAFKAMPMDLQNLDELKFILDGFLEYQLERELKAEKSMEGVV